LTRGRRNCRIESNESGHPAQGTIIPVKLIPLKDAPWAFATQRLWDERLRATKRADEAAKSAKRTTISASAVQKPNPENAGETLKLLAEGFGEIIEDLKIRSAPELAMRAHLLQKLREGKLEACGVQSAPKQMRELEVLPRHFFIDAKINWDGNKVTNLGATYGVVQIRRRSSETSLATTEEALNVTTDASWSALAKPVGQEVGKVNAALPDAQTRALSRPADYESAEVHRRKPGPLSGKAAVIAAYNQLSQKGVLKEGMTFKAIRNQLLPILERNSAIFPNGRGLSNASIARHLSPYLRSKFSS
jgi:hypothetical protein